MDAFTAAAEKTAGPLARLPAIAVTITGAVWVTGDGRWEALAADEAGARIAGEACLLCNRPLVARRLSATPLEAYDVLELFAFVRPARFTLPTPTGLAEALALEPEGADPAGPARLIRRAAERLLADLGAETYRYARGAAAIAEAMGRSGWPWAPLVLERLDRSGAGAETGAVWNGLAEWEESAPPPPPDDHPVGADEAGQWLTSLLGEQAEARPAQRDYARAAAFAFTPREEAGAPNLALAEAGTGTGKTLGYIAPAAAWAKKNRGAVWLSTYTRNLQRQIDNELARLYPDPRERARRVVVRKGRENYACLLNIEEAAKATLSGAANPRDAVMMGLVLRWLAYTRDGDMMGGDLPSWLASYFGRARLGSLTDHRGECIYSACPHYRRCFIEKVTRRTRRAELVVANHALVMSQAALRRGDPELPRRLVFDEGHHVFDAADSAFSAELTGLEASELRRWLRGRETASRGRARGLMSRIEDLIGQDETAWPRLQEALEAARALPGPGWLKRISSANPQSVGERFLMAARSEVLARAQERGGQGYSLECAAQNLQPGLLDAARDFDAALDSLARPLGALAGRLVALLDEEAESLDTATRGRIEASARALTLRSETVKAWQAMLAALEGERDARFVDWFELSRQEGRELDVGLHRRWVDPTEPLAETVLEPAHGAVITSATLLDRQAAEDQEDWRRAEMRSGTAHLVKPAQRFSADSPFDYAAQSRVIVVTDVKKGDLDQLGGATRALMQAAGGGGLGLFTAIARLKGVHARIAPALEAAGLPLYAQHIDPMDTGTLVDIFRAEERACLLGTDAVRDGVDVPGDSLRLIVFDRVPWPRPNLLHKARRAAVGGASYDDMITRLRLAQAFGRLIRKSSDRGVFVLLDAQTPSRLLSALPAEVQVQRMGLKEAVAATRDFLADAGQAEA